MRADIRVANAPCSWGVLEFEESAGATPQYQRVLDEITLAGYAGTELGDWGFLPTAPHPLREALLTRGLALLGAFVPVALALEAAHAEGLSRALRTARLLAAVEPRSMIVLSDDNGVDVTRAGLAGRIGPEHGLGLAAWRAFGRAATAIARAVRDETGLGTAFHHHCGGFVETPAEIERFADATDPEAVGFCLDTGHVTYGGGDALAMLRLLGDRVRHVHFKDCDPRVAAEARTRGWGYLEAVRRGVFCELGAGQVDFAAIAGELAERRYAGWIVVEQDVFPGMGAPLESATRSRAFLRALGL